MCLLLCETFANGEKYVALLFNSSEKEAHFMSQGINLMANLTWYPFSVVSSLFSTSSISFVSCCVYAFIKGWSFSQSSHGKIFPGWSGGEIKEIQTRSLFMHFGCNFGIYFRCSDDWLEGWCGPGMKKPLAVFDIYMQNVMYKQEKTKWYLVYEKDMKWRYQVH